MLKQLDIVSGSSLDRKKRLGLCCVSQCMNKRGHRGKNKFCHKHARQHQKINNPLRYYYDAWKQNAKRRCKDFTVTFEQFKEFCAKNNYIEKKGRFKDSYSIDRIRDNEGYHYNNIQVLKVGDNSRKQFVDMKIRQGHYPTAGELQAYRDSFSLMENDCPQFATRQGFDPENIDYSQLEDAPF